MTRTEKANDYKLLQQSQKTAIEYYDTQKFKSIIMSLKKLEFNQYNEGYFIFGDIDPIPEHYITYHYELIYYYK